MPDSFPNETEARPNDTLNLLVAKVVRLLREGAGGGGGGGGDASAANQTTEIARLDSILAKILAAPSTEAKQDIEITALAAILAKIIAAPATEAKQDLMNVVLGVPTGAGVVTDANGTIHQYLRGLVAMAEAGTLVKQGGGALQDWSGDITAGGTSQEIIVATAARKYILVQNISDEALYLNFGAAATVDDDSMKLLTGGSYENPPNFCPTGTVNIIGATTGSKFVVKEG